MAFSVSSRLVLVAVSLLAPVANGFVIMTPHRLQISTAQHALRRNVVPRTTSFGIERMEDIRAAIRPDASIPTERQSRSSNAVAGLCLAVAILLAPVASWAVSGGGLDFAGLDITSQDYSNANYKGKDFTQVIAKGTNFAKSNLQGCRFYKAYLVNADFAGADLRGASLEDTSMDGAILKDTVAVGAYFSASVIDVASLENADFTDAQFPMKTIPLLCEREDLKGANPVTGVDTRESVMCP